MTIAKLYSLHDTPNNVPKTWADNEVIVGLECEIESIASYGDVRSDLFSVKNDSSLRNHGLEFVTYPMTSQKALEAFVHLQGVLVFRDAPPFTHRTSTHVHLNCLDMTPDQVKLMVILYSLYEECFFAMVDPSRRFNIHCVPINETVLSTHYKRPLPSLRDRWHKYTALNLLPLAELGTVEFRHMHGHGDERLIGDWLTVIRNLRNLSLQEVDLVGLVTDEEKLYSRFRYLFGHTPLDASWPALRMKMENSLIDIKLGL